MRWCRPVRPVHLAIGALLGSLVVGCGSGALIQLAGEDYPFPPKKVLKGAAAARVTGAAADALAENVRDLLPALVGTNDAGWACVSLDELLSLDSIELPLELGPFVGNIGVRELGICLDLASLSVTFIPGSDPAQIRLAVDHGRLAFDGEPVIFGTVDFGFEDVSAACRLQNDLPGIQNYVADVSFVVLMTLSVDDNGAFTLATELEDLEVHDVGITVYEDCALAECSDPNPGNIGSPCLECSVCTAGEFGADLLELVHGLIGDLLDPVIAVVIDAVSEPLLDVLLNGRPLNIAAGVGLGNILGVLTDSARTSRTLGALLRPAPGGFAVTGPASSTGLEIRLDGGTAPDTVHPCVAPLEADPAFAPGVFPNLALPLPDNAPWELAVGISEAMINQAVWSLYGTGALCLALTSREVSDITGGLFRLDAATLDALIPGLSRLAGPSATIRMRVRPRFTAADFPVIELDGNETAPLRLHIPELAVSIDAFVEGDYMPIVSLTTSARTSLGVVTVDGSLQLSIGNIELGEIVVGTAGAFADARLDSVVELAVELLVQVLQSASALSFALDPTALEGILGDLPLSPSLVRVAAGGPGGDWLLVHLNLTGAASGANKPSVRRVRVDGLPWRHVPDDASRSPSPAATLPGTHEIRWSDRTNADEQVVGPSAAPAAGTPNPRGASTSGCQAADAAPTASPLWLLILLLGARRRRSSLRSRTPETLSILLVLSALGCGDPPEAPMTCEKRAHCPPGFTCDPVAGECIIEATCESTHECCPGLTCFEGTCRLMSECTPTSGCQGDDSVCDNGVCIAAACSTADECAHPDHACLAGRCTPTPACGGCPADSACDPVTGRCLNVCGLTCAPGHVALVTNGNSIRGLQCDLADAQCACEALPALPAPRPTGWPVALAWSDGARAVLGRDRQYGDLAFRPLSETMGLSIDGAPAQPVVANPEGPRGGVSEPGPDVGHFAAAVTTGDGRFAAMARNQSSGTLRVLDGTRDGTVLAAYDLPNSDGFGTSMAWSGDTLHAAWFDRTGDALSLRYGTTSSPGTPSSWTLETLVAFKTAARFETPCNPPCGLLDACVQAPNPRCETPDLVPDCDPPCDRDSLCVSSLCLPLLRPTVGARPWLDEPGSETAIATYDGDVSIAWYNRPGGSVELTERSAGTVITTRVAGGEGADVGRGVRFARGPQGHYALAFQNSTLDTIEIHWGTSPQALPRVYTEPGGRGISLAITPTGQLVVAHGSADGSEVRVLVGPTVWVAHTPFSTGQVGRFTALWPGDSNVVAGTVRDRLDDRLAPDPTFVTTVIDL